MQNPETVKAAAGWIRDGLPPGFQPRAAVVLGTGLGGVAGRVEVLAAFDYAAIPGFPPSRLEGHAGRLLAGRLAGLPVLAWAGRHHLYEGRTPAEVCLGVRVSAVLGARTLILTNAAGALNPLFETGRVMAITDHINATGQSPLTGENVDAWGPRFPDMSRVYAQRLADLARDTALRLGLRLEAGVYVGVAGPNLETPAETRLYRAAGADAIGMSTVLEAIAARHMGLDVLGLSCLVNKNLPDCMAEVSLEEVLIQAERSGEDLARLVEAVAGKLARSD